MTTQMINHDNFIRDYLSIFNRVFKSFTVEAPVFSDFNFTSVLLPEDIFLDTYEVSALLKSIRTVGDDRIILTNVEMEPRHTENAVLPATDNFLEYLYKGTNINYSVSSCVLFSPSGKWGMLFDKTFVCRVVGGVPEFMDVFVAECGGVSLINKRFLKYVDHFWNMDLQRKMKILNQYGLILENL